MHIRLPHRPQRPTPALLGSLLCYLALTTPAASQIGDPYGKQTYPESQALAERLADSQPGTAWETALDGEAADLMEFIGDDLLLVGVVEVDRNAAPKHGRLHLFDLASGRQRWRVGRRDMGTGGYELLATEPWLLLKGSDGEEGILTALDPGSGDREWELKFEEPTSLAFLPDGEGVIIFDREDGGARLRSVRLADGDELWSVPVPEALMTQGTPGSLQVHGPVVFMVGRGLAEIDVASGTLGSAVDVPALAEDSGSTLSTDAGILAWSTESVALVDAAPRSVRWTWSTGGQIRTVSPMDGGVLVVSGSEQAPVLTLVGDAAGAERWSWRPGGMLTGPVAAGEGLVLIPMDAELVGLEAASGVERFRTLLPDDVAAGSPSHAEFVGMPDVLRAERGALYLARERAGLLAFELPGGALSWYRPHHETPSTLGRYSGEGRFAYVFEAQLMQSGGVPENLQRPARLGIGSGSSSSLLAAAQRDYEAARGRYDALGSDASSAERASAVADVRTASELGIAAVQLDAAMGQMSAAAELSRSILSFRDVIRAYNVASGLQGLVDRAQLSMRSTLLMQQRLFQSGLYVRPYLMANTGRGVSLVRLDSGLRSDPLFSPVNAPSMGYGLDPGIIRVSPSGERLAMVGISLATDGWKRRGKWDTHVPEMSLLTYRVDDLELAEEARYPYLPSDLIVQGDVEAVRRALESGADPNAIDPVAGDRPLHLAVGLMKPEIVRLLLNAGANPNGTGAAGRTPMQLMPDPGVRELLVAAGAQELEQVGGGGFQAVTSPLFIAISAQNPAMVRKAIAEGADPDMLIGDGQSILYLAVALDNPEMVRLLLELGSNRNWEDANGDSPMDLARTDAVREALRGG